MSSTPTLHTQIVKYGSPGRRRRRHQEKARSHLGSRVFRALSTQHYLRNSNSGPGLSSYYYVRQGVSYSTVNLSLEKWTYSYKFDGNVRVKRLHTSNSQMLTTLTFQVLNPE